MFQTSFSVKPKWERRFTLSVKPAHLENLLDSVQDTANPWSVTTRHRNRIIIKPWLDIMRFVVVFWASQFHVQQIEFLLTVTLHVLKGKLKSQGS